MKIRVVSDGTWHGSKVYDAETGEEIKYVKALTIDFRNGAVHAAIELIQGTVTGEMIVDASLDESVDVQRLRDENAALTRQIEALRRRLVMLPDLGKKETEE